MSSQEIANIYSSINNIQLGLNEVTGNTFSNYNQLSRIVSQQANIYNTVYYGTGNMSTGNLVVSANCNISGNLVLGSGNASINGGLTLTNLNSSRFRGTASVTDNFWIGLQGSGTDGALNAIGIAGNSASTGNVSTIQLRTNNVNRMTILNSGNVGIGTENPLATLDVSGNARITGNVNVDNGLIWTDPTNNRVGINTTAPQTTLQVIGDGNISGSMYSSTGYVPLCRASISFRYASATLTTLYSNNCSVVRNSIGSYTITFTNGPGSTNYTVSTFSAGATASTIAQAWANSGQISVVALKSSTQCLIWISDNNSDAANEPAGMCEVNFFW